MPVNGQSEREQHHSPGLPPRPGLRVVQGSGATRGHVTVGRSILRLVAAIGVVVLLGGAVAYHVHVRHQLEGSIALAHSQLATTSGRLADAMVALQEAQTALGQRTAERDSARADAATLQQQNEVLSACLDGVMSAIGYAADGAYYAAVGALDAVQPQCDQAFELSP
jgi:hypothetical protein